MKPILYFLAFSLMAFSAPAWGAVWYVDHLATGAGDGTSWADAYTTIQAALDAHKADGDIIEVSGGTYAEALNPPYAAGSPARTLRGSTEPGHDDSVIVNSSDIEADTIRCNRPNIRIENLVLISDQESYEAIDSSSAADFVAEDIQVFAPRCLVAASTNQTFRRVKGFSDSTTQTNFNIGPGAGNTITLEHCWIRGGQKNRLYNGGNINFNNFQIEGAKDLNLSQAAGEPTTLLTNCVVMNAPADMESTPLIENTSGTLTARNCILLPHADEGDTQFLTGVTDGGGNVYASPDFMSTRRSALFAIEIDDNVDLDFWVQLCALTEQYGWRASIAVTTDHETYPLDSDDWDTLAYWVSRGHEVNCHSATHTKLGIDGAFRIRYSGAGTTATVEITGGHLITKVDSVTDIDLDLSAFERVTDLTTYLLQNYSDYDFGGESDIEESFSQGQARVFCLASFSAQDIKNPADYRVTFDEPTWFDYEIVQPKATIESELTTRLQASYGWTGSYECKVFVWPNYSNSASSRAAALAAGFIGARAGYQQYDLSNLGIYNTMGNRPEDMLCADSSDHTNLERNFAATLNHWQYMGYMWVLHSYDPNAFSGSLSLAEWKYILDEFKAHGADVRLHSAIYEHIRESGLWATADSGSTWTRSTWADNSDYRPRPGSPCIDAGLDLGLTEDFAGNPITGAPDIGLYQSSYQSEFPLLRIMEMEPMRATEVPLAQVYQQ